MGFNFAQFNKFRFNYDAVSAEWDKNDKSRYVSLKDLYKKYGPDHIFEIKSAWIRKAKKDDKGNIIDGSIKEENPVITIEGLFVNIPWHQLEEVRPMHDRDDAVEFINNGGAGFMIREYDNQYQKGEKAYSARWCNMDDGSVV